MHNEEPGITLTEDVRERIRRAGSGARAEGLSIARELWWDLMDIARGVYIMPPFGHYEVCVELLATVKDGIRI